MIKNKISIGWMLLFLVACTPEWDDHYDAGQATVTDQTVMEYIGSRPEYSAFAALLKEVGTDTVFTGSNQVTVWVPANDKVPDLSGLSDSLRRLTIKNHVSMLPYTTTDMKDQTRVTAFSGKKLGIYSEDNISFRVNQCRLVKTDMICKDGVVQEIGGWLGLQPNLREYLEQAPEYTLLQGLINNVQDSIFDEKNSVATGEYDALGRPLYDSVFLYVNKFYNYTRLGQESSLMTLFLTPDWILEEEIESYYKALLDYRGDPAKGEDSTALESWLVRSIPYSGAYTDFTTGEPLLSLYSVSWRPEYQQLGTLQEFSNGLVWQVNDLYIPRSMIFPSDGSGQTYVMNDIYTKKEESINIRLTGNNPDATITDDPLVECDRTNGYKVTVTPLDEGNTEPFNVELSWTLGKTTTSGTYRQITQLPGEYKFEFTFKKSEDLTTDFDIYINGEWIIGVSMADYKNVTVGNNITVTKRVEIDRSYEKTPTQITMRATGGTGGTQVLSVYSIFFQPTANNY